MTAIAKVFVNNIEVGAVPLTQYHAIEKRARLDWRLYVVQGVNLLNVCLNFTLSAVRSLPALWLFAAVAWALLDADAMIRAAAELATITPDALREGVKWLLWRSVSLMLGFQLCCVIVFGFRRYGFKDIFEGAVNRRVSEVLEVPAEGKLFILVEEPDRP